MKFIQFRIGDIVQMKKKHPCGSQEWEVLQLGSDMRIYGRVGTGRREAPAAHGGGKWYARSFLSGMRLWRNIETGNCMRKVSCRA